MSVLCFNFYSLKLRVRGTKSVLEVIKRFSCSTQLSMKFKLLKTKMLKNKEFFVFKLTDVVDIMLINVKMPTIHYSTTHQKTFILFRVYMNVPIKNGTSILNPLAKASNGGSGTT